MFTIILVMGFGVILGFILRNRKLPFLNNIIMVLIWVLLFLLGVEVGGDETLIRGIGNLGAEGLAIATAGVVGSALLAFFLWKWAGMKNKRR